MWVVGLVVVLAGTACTATSSKTEASKSAQSPIQSLDPINPPTPAHTLVGTYWKLSSMDGHAVVARGMGVTLDLHRDGIGGITSCHMYGANYKLLSGPRRIRVGPFITYSIGGCRGRGAPNRSPTAAHTQEFACHQTSGSQRAAVGR